MTTLVFGDRVSCVLSSPADAGATTIVVWKNSAVPGSIESDPPAVSGGQQGIVYISNAIAWEIAYYTARADGGSTWTLTLTSALAHAYAAGDSVQGSVPAPWATLLEGHRNSTANPHATTAAQVGADPAGTAAGLVTAHAGASDPHPQYLTAAEASAVFAPLGSISTAVSSVFRNVLANGNFGLWARGTSFAAQGSIVFAADRWQWFRGGYVTGATLTRVAPAHKNSKWGVKLQRDSGNTSTQNLFFCQALPTDTVVRLRGKIVTVQALVKAGANFSGANVRFQFRTGTGTESKFFSGFTGATTVLSGSAAPSTTQTLVTYTASAVVPNDASQAELQIDWAPTGTAGADDSVTLEQVQLEEGSTASSFEFRDETIESSLCARFCRVASVWVGASGAKTVFPIAMRATPSISGGGTGFNSTGTTADTLVCYQTTAASQTLTLDAEI